ncbi:MAG: hypothetical protein COW24_03840 [Candidatus Kerfeldbacteria bacterium CG15_BIG_FIL_POST_REV_8_21_14_020_45_12]|uniref:Cytosol aminopeptidase domain-containing protein n=1 Tax=Candidatus Kerfeldbacteria bacterium CG15_BIG_FIL_POST_REV_8_21_14_020_45_12 TaxID=2014247 RepID=A0A2M7H354_9BACT|nr:MAG: hypothetical protein COW24_03840 [Candidatus Kerfeldbacteria bacterium CG15_BIG_FIL_POST_REV_8_21_14_020_45_12]PJA93540.1 MAG: hypothetical protein CO132_02825 [Candidatus Kerfeldbacteria bacterium CG_4_9_14_3_um_filter_45_8]
MNALHAGTVAARWQNWGRTLVQLDSSVITPVELIDRAIRAAEGLNRGIVVDRMDEAELRTRGYDLAMAVNRGSTVPAAGVVLEYRGCPTSKSVIDLVGKGVTKDNGGEALKPAASSAEMHMDMAGAASAFAIFLTAVELGLKVNLRCRVIGVRNVLGSSSYSNGDVIHSGILGKDVRIINTDAEGRLVLIEQIAAARKDKTTLIIDLATLTGAACVALKDMTAIFTNRHMLGRSVMVMAMAAGDPAWEMPSNQALLKELLDVADGADIGNSALGKEGGAGRAAEFLFWGNAGEAHLHLDIAPQLANGKTTGWRVKGGEAPQVRTIVRLLEFISHKGQDQWVRNHLV